MNWLAISIGFLCIQTSQPCLPFIYTIGKHQYRKFYLFKDCKWTGHLINYRDYFIIGSSMYRQDKYYILPIRYPEKMFEYPGESKMTHGIFQHSKTSRAYTYQTRGRFVMYRPHIHPRSYGAWHNGMHTTSAVQKGSKELHVGAASYHANEEFTLFYSDGEYLYVAKKNRDNSEAKYTFKINATVWDIQYNRADDSVYIFDGARVEKMLADLSGSTKTMMKDFGAKYRNTTITFDDEQTLFVCHHKGITMYNPAAAFRYEQMQNFSTCDAMICFARSCFINENKVLYKYHRLPDPMPYKRVTPPPVDLYKETTESEYYDYRTYTDEEDYTTAEPYLYTGDYQDYISYGEYEYTYTLETYYEPTEEDIYYESYIYSDPTTPLPPITFTETTTEEPEYTYEAYTYEDETPETSSTEEPDYTDAEPTGPLTTRNPYTGPMVHEDFAFYQARGAVSNYFIPVVVVGFFVASVLIFFILLYICYVYLPQDSEESPFFVSVSDRRV